MTVDQLFLSAATAAVGIIGTLVTQWVTARFTEQNRIASLESANAILKVQNSQITESHLKEMATLHAENADLRAYVHEHMDRENLRKNYELHENGTLVRDGRQFCFSCFEGNTPPILAPIVFRDGYDRCTHCDKIVR